LFYKPLWDVRNEITREFSGAATEESAPPQFGHGKQY
jgi:hypothetical protein